MMGRKCIWLKHAEYEHGYDIQEASKVEFIPTRVHATLYATK
jgi:hypothetical protein